MNKTNKDLTPSLVEDSMLAYDMAVEYDKHWEVAKHAKELGLSGVAAYTLLAGELAMTEIQNATHGKPQTVDLASHEAQPLKAKELSLRVRARTFEEAAQRGRKVSDKFITDVLTSDDNFLPLRVDGERKTIKGYLDGVPMDDSDRAFIDNPEHIVDLYRHDTEMIKRQLKVTYRESARDSATQMKEAMLRKVQEQEGVNPNIWLLNTLFSPLKTTVL